MKVGKPVIFIPFFMLLLLGLSKERLKLKKIFCSITCLIICEMYILSSRSKKPSQPTLQLINTLLNDSTSFIFNVFSSAKFGVKGRYDSSIGETSPLHIQVLI